ncbi:uncharacterized protein [Argopecten irradians]|uniref:uncharacterized protein n=1 Tax=Argopecten irradians TaxID=31199 RepID=UPI003719EDB9
MLNIVKQLTPAIGRVKTCCLFRSSLYEGSLTRASSLVFRSKIAICRRQSSSTASTGSEYSNELLLEKRYIPVRTCYDLWYDVPKAGLTFDVEYYDSRPDESIDPGVPLVLALHDSPGSAKDLLPVLHLLARLGYRVIAPNFPGYGKTKWNHWKEWNVFTGAIDEKMHFVFDFQATLNIARVDVLLGHGLGCSTCVALAGTDSKMYRSVALLCPAEHLPLKPSRGRLRFQTAARLSQYWETLQTRPFVWFYMMLMKSSYGYSGYTTKQVIDAARTIAGGRYTALQAFMVRLQVQEHPCRVVYHSVKDSKVPPDVSLKYAELLGIKPEQFVVYQSHRKLSNPGEVTSPKGLQIAHDTPELIEAYSKPIASMVLDLVRTLKPKR